jgi:hypothetical protein
MNFTRLSQPPNPRNFGDKDVWRQAVYDWMEDTKASIETDSTINVASTNVLAPLASPALTGTPTAPTASYGDATTQIATDAFVQAAVTPTFDNVGRNKIHNALFNIQQRGAGAFTTNAAYTADRWQMFLTSDTFSTTLAALSDADRTAIGNEEAAYYLNAAVTGNAAAGAFSQLVQKIENVRRLANKTVTVSFYAKASSGTPKIGVNVQQSFGTGGSPSATVNVAATGTPVTLSTSWARYSATFSLPSISGKTLGSNFDTSTILNLGFSSGATNNAFYGNIGVQTATFQLFGVQVEGGSAATPLETLDPPMDLANCQRFYQTFAVFALGYNAAGGNVWGTWPFAVVMRGTPSITYSGQSYANASALATYSVNAAAIVTQATVTATGQAAGSGTVALTADL